MTSLEYRLHPVDMVYVGIVIYPMEHAETVSRFYRDHLASAPEEFGAFLAFHLGPPVPFLPEEWHGKPVCVVVGMWTGDQAEGPARWQPFLDVAPGGGIHDGADALPGLEPAFDALQPQGMLATGKRTSWRSSMTAPSPRTSNTAQGPQRANRGAYLPHRRRCPAGGHHGYGVRQPEREVFARDRGAVEDPADNEANIAWVRDYAAALRPYSAPGGYINFMDGDDLGRVAENYGPNYKRLREVKAKYDPQNLFHVNQNITPA